jgi:nucleotide-binding universal stress UspA family protein
MGRVLVPIDGSEPSDRAVVFGARMAAALGARLDLVHVLDVSRLDVYDGFYLSDERVARIESEVEERMLAAARALVPEGVEATTRVLKGPLLDMLLLEADRPDVELVVVGRTGKNRLERVLDGSVSRRLSTHARSPVALVS